jgi:hypothetical protein
MKQLLKVAKKMAKKDKEVPRITRRRKKRPIGLPTRINIRLEQSRSE